MNERADIAGAHSKALTANPKDLFGAKKVSISKLPAIAVLHGAHAMMDGARKYGAYNWRDKKVVAGIYIDAAMRHIQAWFEGEEVASDSGVHHLGHAIACCAILLDARETGNLIDDRPGDPVGSFGIAMRRLNDAIAVRAAAAEAAQIEAAVDQIAARKPGEFRVGDQVRFKADAKYQDYKRRWFPAKDVWTVKEVRDRPDDPYGASVRLVGAPMYTADGEWLELVEPAQ